ncbi:MAG: TetR family transcriptional regulator C-terminal domain-containing protein [Chloroflexi bacterium]|nr:TetR family transcriptional regulator C-terminal domain-containing protein [Chloroflexota bacterium]
MEIIDRYVSGAILALIGWWLENDQPYTIEQMAKVADDLSLSVLTRLERVTEIASANPARQQKIH